MSVDVNGSLCSQLLKECMVLSVRHTRPTCMPPSLTVSFRRKNNLIAKCVQIVDSKLVQLITIDLMQACYFSPSSVLCAMFSAMCGSKGFINNNVFTACLLLL